ncbi:hypothetical protein B9G55_13700 [Saccharibacillus sp. O16]|nr:hypothetical protein B9G55_13700 [Saccharibacillus sp. O16]
MLDVSKGVDKMKKSAKWAAIGGAAGIAAAWYAYRSKKDGKSINPMRRLFPIFTMPEPTGHYAVGMFEAHLIDHNRQETRRGTLSQGAGSREVAVTVWYPADRNLKPEAAALTGSPGAAVEPEHYPDSLGKCISLVFGLPSGLFRHLSKIQTHAFRDLPLAAEEAPYPVLLFSPGIRSTRYQNLTMIEELVSRGYIVVGMDHPYTAGTMRLADGQDALYIHEPKFAESRELYDYNVKEVGVRALDARFVLDTLEKWNQTDSGHLLAGRMDLSRTGIVGHSYGGATAAEALATDDRLAAALSLEGGFWGEVSHKPLEKPFMYLFTGGTERSLDPNQSRKEAVFFEEWQEDVERVMTSSRHDTFFAVVEPFFHQSFSDLPLVSPRLFARSLTPERAIDITRTYAVAFFDQYLRGKEASMIGQNTAEFPEVRYDDKYTQIRSSEAKRSERVD